MAKEVELADGTKETVFTNEDISAKDAEIARLSGLVDEKTENFKKINESTEKLKGEVDGLKETLAQKETREKDEAKVNSAQRFHAGDDALKTKLEENYGKLAGMPESTATEIAARMGEAARLSGIAIDSQVNPLNAPFSGEAPRSKPSDEKAKEDEFLKSEKGVAAQKAMGFSEEDINGPKQ